jgi:hypothetical protein
MIASGQASRIGNETEGGQLFNFFLLQKGLVFLQNFRDIAQGGICYPKKLAEK